RDTGRVVRRSERDQRQAGDRVNLARSGSEGSRCEASRIGERLTEEEVLAAEAEVHRRRDEVASVAARKLPLFKARRGVGERYTRTPVALEVDGLLTGQVVLAELVVANTEVERQAVDRSPPRILDIIGRVIGGDEAAEDLVGQTDARIAI